MLPATSAPLDGPARQRHREVERADHGPHAVRPQHVVVVAGGAEAAHRDAEAVVLLHLVAVPADQLGGLLDVAERLEPALADLVGHQRREVEDPLLHDVGDVAQDPHALLPAHPVPLELERLRGRDGVVDVLGGGLRELPISDVLVDRRRLVVGLVAPALLAVDDDRVGLAELGLGPARRRRRSAACSSSLSADMVA